MAPPTVGRSSHFNKHNQNNFQRHVNQIQIISYCDSLGGVKLTEQILTDCPTYLFMERVTEPRTQQFSYTCWYRSQGFSCLCFSRVRYRHKASTDGVFNMASGGLVNSSPQAYKACHLLRHLPRLLPPLIFSKALAISSWVLRDNYFRKSKKGRKE